MSADGGRTISFDDEALIVVDEDNRVLDHLPKADVHAGEGILHRAFSVFLFDDRGRLLVQQRSALKPLWPLHWSNTCCSHPRRGETEVGAAHRRLSEELGLEVALTYVYTFTYHARYADHGSERELCSVFLGRAQGEPRPHPEEIAALRWLAAEALDTELAQRPETWTPWLHLEWARLRGEHAAALAPFLS